MADIVVSVGSSPVINTMNGDEYQIYKILENIETQLSNKVDKISGKGLSSNDYTAEEKTKLSELPTKTELDDELTKKLNADEAVGKRTEQGGEVFNNYNTNVALGTHSHAEGDKTSTGLVGLIATVSLSHYFYIVSVPLNVINKLESYDVVDFYQDVSTDNNNVKYEFVKSVQVGTINDESFTITTAVPAGQYLIRVRGKDIGTDLIKQYSGDYAHAEGHETVADGKYSHVEGNRNIANGDGSHAEGGNTDAIGYCSHTEGIGTKAIGKASHAEGWSTQAIDEYSHAEGSYTVANGESQHVQGKWNKEDTENKYAHIVGNGTSSSKRSNAHTLDWGGNAWYQGDIRVGGTSYDDGKTLETKATITTSTETSPSITLADNTETRFAEITSLAVALPETLSDSFISSAVFKSGATATTVTVPSDVYCQGADCKNGVFTPKANKRYTMIFSYDGIMNCYIAAVPIQTAETQSENVAEDEASVMSDESAAEDTESVTEEPENIMEPTESVTEEPESEPNEVI